MDQKTDRVREVCRHRETADKDFRSVDMFHDTFKH